MIFPAPQEIGALPLRLMLPRKDDSDD